MKKISFLFLILPLVFVGFYACDDDDNDSAPITYEMVISDRDSGVFYALDTTTGALESLGYISYNGEILTDIRGLTYDTSSEKIYLSENSHSNQDSKSPEDVNGRIFSVNPETLQATLIRDNANNDWDAVSGLVMDDGLILGTVYWNDYPEANGFSYHNGLVWLNTDGTIDSHLSLMYEGSEYEICCGMAMVNGTNANEVYISSYWDDYEIIKTNVNGDVIEVLELNFIGNFEEEDRIKNLAWGNDNVLYAVTTEGDLGSIDVSTGDFTFIVSLDMMGVSDSDWQALTMIPEFVFEDFGSF